MGEMFDRMTSVWDWFGSTEPYGLYWLMANTLVLGLLWLGILVVSVRLHKRSRRRMVRWPTRAFNWLWVMSAAVIAAVGLIWAIAEQAYALFWIIAPWIFGAGPVLVPGFKPYPPLWLMVVTSASLWVALWVKKETRERPEPGGMASLLWWTQWPDALYDPNADTVVLKVVKRA